MAAVSPTAVATGGKFDWEEEMKQLGGLFELLMSPDIQPVTSPMLNQPDIQMVITRMLTRLEAEIEIFVQQNLRQVRCSLRPLTPVGQVVELFEQYWRGIEQLTNLMDNLNRAGQGENDAWISIAIDKLKLMYWNMMTHSIYWTNQPPSTLRTYGKFEASVQFLVPPSQLSQGMNRLSQNNDHVTLQSSIVSIDIVDQSHVTAVYLGNEPPKVEERKKEDVKFERVMGIDPSVIELREISLSRAPYIKKRSNSGNLMEDKKAEGRLEQKYFFKFSCRVFILGEMHKLSCFSTPFVYYSHMSQLPLIKGSIFWDTQFRDHEAPVPFCVLQSVPLFSLVSSLANFFTVETCGKDLTPFQLDCLKKIIQKDQDEIIEREKFFKKCQMDINFPDKKFSLWDWFLKVISLIRSCQDIEHLWNKRFLMGFITRSIAETILNSQHPGTFLIRFSRTCIGEMSVSFVDEDDEVRHIRCDERILKLNVLQRSLLFSTKLTHILWWDENEGQKVTSKFDCLKSEDELDPREGYIPGGLILMPMEKKTSMEVHPHPLATFLISYFKEKTNCSRDLTPFNLKNLCKILRDQQKEGRSCDSMESQNLEEKKGFSSYDWINGLIQLFQDYPEIQQIWDEGFIVGFIHRPLIHKILKSKPPGTFLIRFSTTQIGQIVLSFVDDHKKVWHCCLYNPDLEVVTLRESIRSMTQLSHIFFVTPDNEELVNDKFEAFPSSLKTKSDPVPFQPRRGYVESRVVMVLNFPN